MKTKTLPLLVAVAIGALPQFAAAMARRPAAAVGGTGLSVQVMDGTFQSPSSSSSSGTTGPQTPAGVPPILIPNNPGAPIKPPPVVFDLTGLSQQRVQAQQIAQSNGAANAANVASQLAAAFGPDANSAQLLAKAKQLATATPAEAKAIAAAAAVFNPVGAAQIAAALAKINPSQAAAIAAAVAAVAPAQSEAIAAAVIAAVPDQASAVAAALAPGAGPNQATTTGFGNNTQNTMQNPANLSAGNATPTPTPKSTPTPTPKSTPTPTPSPQTNSPIY